MSAKLFNPSIKSITDSTARLRIDVLSVVVFPVSVPGVSVPVSSGSMIVVISLISYTTPVFFALASATPTNDVIWQLHTISKTRPGSVLGSLLGFRNTAAPHMAYSIPTARVSNRNVCTMT
jgi:hypothetical protein